MSGKRMTEFSSKDVEAYILTYRQEELRWRRIVFLPFSFAWRMLMATFGMVYFSLVIFEEIFMKDFEVVSGQKSTFRNFLSFITVCHTIDWSLSVVHRVWARVQKSMPYQPKSVVVLAVDALAILPIRYLGTSQHLLKDNHINWISLMNLNGCLRVYRIFKELLSLHEKMWMNPVLVSLVQQNALILSMVSILSSIWYIIGVVMRDKPRSWLQDFMAAADQESQQNPFDLYVFSIVYTYVLLSNEMVADIRPLNQTERCFIIFTRYIGAILKYSILLGTMLLSFLKYQGHMYRIKDHISINKSVMKGKKEKLVTEYYAAYWNNWSGLHTCPLLHTFPLCMRKDVLTDVYWNAIEHSHFLRQFPPNIKRRVSLKMKSIFMQPGDYIFRKGQMRTTYYYIASGFVQIMSHYDGVSPILTIGSGSSLGGKCLTLPSPCPTDVICSTVCELRYLTFRGFYATLTAYTSCVKTTRNIHLAHMRHVKITHNLSYACMDDNPIMKLYGVPQDDKLRWIKQRWRVIHGLQEVGNLLSEVKAIQIMRHMLPADVRHTSKYLDCYAISTDLECDASKCCTRTTCPYTLEPSCSFVRYWLSYTCIIITIDCIFVPYCTAFSHNTPEGLICWENFVLYSYAVDIYIQIITQVRSVDRTISEPIPLLRYHLTRVTFIIDIVATLPIRELARVFATDAKISPYFTFTRMLKIVRVCSYFKSKYNNVTASSMITHVLKYLYLWFFIMYFAACIFFVTSCQFEGETLVCAELSWYDHLLEDIQASLNEDVATNWDNAVMTTYLLSKYILRSGFAAIPLLRYYDRIFVTVVLFISINVMMFVYSEMMAMWVMRRHRMLVFLNLNNSLGTVLKQKNIPIGLQDMVTTYMNLQWATNCAIDFQLGLEDTEIVSPILENEQRMMISEKLKTISYFSELDRDVFERFVCAFKVYTVPKGYIFCRSGNLPHSFTIIIRGVCNLTSMLREDVLQYPKGKVVGPGQHFSLMEILTNIVCLQTAVSLTVCKVVAIEATELTDLLTANEENWSEHVEQSANFAEDDLDIVTSKVKYRKTFDVTESFILRRTNKTEQVQVRHLSRLTSFLHRCLNLTPWIIHPHGHFMFVWETLKVIQIVILLLFMPAGFTLFCGFEYYQNVIFNLLNTFSLVDVIVRLHLGHYNKDGLLVHSYFHYMSHSLTVDFVSSLPIYDYVQGYDFKLRYFITNLVKGLQVYRISGYILAFRTRFNISEFMVLIILFSSHLTLLIYTIAFVIFVIMCETECKENDVSVKCSAGTWFAKTDYFDEKTAPFKIILLFGNIALYAILGNDQGGYFASSSFEMRMIIIFSIAAAIYKTYYIPRLVSRLVGIPHNFTIHRENYSLFWSFVRNEGGNLDIAKSIFNHFVFNYGRMKGIQMKEFMEGLHPSLQCDLSFVMYYKGMLCLHQFVGSNKSFMRLLAHRFVETHFLKKTPVLLVNQVNDQLYFIREGYVDVFSYEDEKVETLGPGSVFGPMKKIGRKRHKFKYVSKYNTILLLVSAREFMIMLKLYNVSYYHNFIQATRNKEFVQHWLSLDTIVVEESDKDITYPNILYANSPPYKWSMYFLSMTVPYLTMFPLLLCMSVSYYLKSIELLVTLYILDFISLFRIFFGFTVTYNDEETGIYVSKKKVIRRKYLFTLSQFPLDLLSVFPFEIIGYLITQKWITILMGNRLLRIFIMSNYIYYYKERTYVRIWLRWFEYIIAITLPIYFMTCLWIAVICRDGCLNARDDPSSLITGTYEVFAYSLNVVVTLLTFSTSMSMEKPWNFQECVVIVFICIVGFVLVPKVIAKFIQASMMSNYNQRIYDYNTYCMRVYLQLRDLSASLMESLWSYSLLLYKTNHGHNVPPYVQNCPFNMRCELFNDLYGGHIKYNILFEGCNNDLIFQLAGHLKRTVYFPGDFIVRKFDVDGRIYFINSGEVEELEFDEMYAEVVESVYITGQCFGLSQGLYDRTPYLKNYKARTMVEILTLQKSEWTYLIDYFPEDTYKIFNIAHKLSLDSMQSLM